MAITGKSGTRAIAKRYPVTDGLTAETTTQKGHEEHLTPSEKSLILEDNKKGIG